RMLSELLSVEGVSVPPQDEAVPTNHQTKVLHPPDQLGLHTSLQLFHLRNTLRENERCGSLTSHGSVSKAAGLTAKVPISSPFGPKFFSLNGIPDRIVKPMRTWFPRIATTVSRMLSPMMISSPCSRLSTNIIHTPIQGISILQGQTFQLQCHR